jgi:hypothetical protein
MSLTDTFVAVDGPLLVTSSSQVKPPPAPTCGTLAVFTIAMSATGFTGVDSQSTLLLASIAPVSVHGGGMISASSCVVT